MYMSTGMPCDHLLVQKGHAVCAPRLVLAPADKALRFSVQLMVEQA